MNNELLILGAGGHSKVIIEAARLCGYQPSSVFDDDESLIGTEILGVPVTGTIRALPDDIAGNAFIAIGSNRVRKMLVARLQNLKWPTLIHPTAYISPTVKPGRGTVICAGAVVQPEASIGNHVIINTGANIDHDCQIADFAHICPGCNLAGAARVGEGVFLGTGSTVIPLKQIGEWCVIGAGTVIVNDIAPESRAVGVPARILKA